MTTVTRASVPGAVRLARALLIAIDLLAQRVLVRPHHQRYSGFGQAEVVRSAEVTIEFGAVFHGILLVLCVVPARDFFA
ncbi:hypothetical protein [Amycolatopsis sp. cmx-11-51]|uniref:hypothetical protein n=1 Tax=unclassified Amycolatopsis TaxID=2618356 RepID=UPI0039E59C91